MLKLDKVINKSYYENLIFAGSGFASVMLQCRCHNLSRVFFGVFFNILSNISLNAISSSDIFAVTASVFIFLFFNLISNISCNWKICLFYHHILFTVPMSANVFLRSWGYGKFDPLNVVDKNIDVSADFWCFLIVL